MKLNKRYNELKSFLTEEEQLEFHRYIRRTWDAHSVLYLEKRIITAVKQREINESKNLNRFAFNRNIEHYIGDIMIGWLVEDFINLFYFSGKLEKTGDDKDRVLLFGGNMFNKVGKNLDGEYNGILIDITADWSNYSNRNNSLTVNFNKYNKMKELNAHLIVLDVVNKRVLDIDMSKDVYKSEQKERLVYGNKGKKMYVNEIYFNYKEVVSKSLV